MSGAISAGIDKWDWRSVIEDVPADQRYELEERAAIYEFDAGMSREEAERRVAREAGLQLL